MPEPHIKCRPVESTQRSVSRLVLTITMKTGSILVLAAIGLVLVLGLSLNRKKATETVRLVSVEQQPQSSALAEPQAVAGESAARKDAAGEKFATMGVLRRNEILTEIRKRDLAEIFQAMLDARRIDDDARKQQHLQTTLMSALRERTPTPEFIQQMRDFINSSANSKFERQLLLGALRSAATKETVDLLIEIATNSPDPEMRQEARGLGSVGDTTKVATALAPSFERLWKDSNDKKLLSDAAIAMAKSGELNGIELLLSAALDGQDDMRKEISLYMLNTQVSRSAAVKPLATRLNAQSTTNTTSNLVAPILVRVGDKNAGKAVVEWLQRIEVDATQLVRDRLFQETHTNAMVAAWEAALDPTFSFRNEQNREAIRAGLASRNAGRRFEKNP